MKCPNCGYDNAPDALCCNLCQMVLRKEAAAAPPPAQPRASASVAGPVEPPEPAKLDQADDIKNLLLLATKRGEQDRFDEVERLMSRIFLEIEPEITCELFAECGKDWIRGAPLDATEQATSQALIATIATCVRGGKFDLVHAQCQALMKVVRDARPESFRLQLMMFGIKGAEKRVKAGAAAPPKASGVKPSAEPPEPKLLNSMETWRDMILIAHNRAMTGDIKEAARLTTRIFSEISLNDCDRLLVIACENWLESCGLQPPQKDEIRKTVAAAGKFVAAGKFRAAHDALRPVVMTIKLEPGPAMRFGLLALGIKGVAGTEPK